MTYPEAIEILEKQIFLLERTTGLEAWFDTAEHFIQDIFGVVSTQVSNFRQLKRDFAFEKIYKHDYNAIKENEKKFQTKAIQQMSGLILYLREKEQLEIKEQERQQIIKKQREAQQRVQVQNEQEEQKRRQAVQKKITEEQIRDTKPNPQPVKKHWMKKLSDSFKSITIPAWGIIIGAFLTALTFIYKLGYDNGTAKFDNDKINLSNENSKLKIDLSKARDSINLIPIVVFDSLSKAKQ